MNIRNTPPGKPFVATLLKYRASFQIHAVPGKSYSSFFFSKNGFFADPEILLWSVSLHAAADTCCQHLQVLPRGSYGLYHTLELLAVHDMITHVLKPAGRAREGQRRTSSLIERLDAPKDEMERYLAGGRI